MTGELEEFLRKKPIEITAFQLWVWFRIFEQKFEWVTLKELQRREARL